MPGESVTRVTKDSRLIGTECIHCHKKIEAETDIVVCPRCKAVHHVECWKERKGCARLGCRQIAQNVREESQKASESGDNIYLEKERPKRKWKIALGVLALVAIITLLTYRGPDPAAGRDKITLMVQGGYLEISFYEEFAEKFNQAHPNLYLETLVTPVAGYEQKLVVMFGARLAPDVFITPSDRYPMYAQQGGLLPLDDYLASHPEAVERFFPDGLEPLRIDGAIYGIPHPYANEVFCIYALEEKPDVAWKTLMEVLAEIEENYPTQLRTQAEISDPIPLFP